MPPDEVRLHHMLDAARKTLDFTNGRSRSALDTDEQLTLAVVRLLEIIGEAAKKVTAETRTPHHVACMKRVLITPDECRTSSAPIRWIVGLIKDGRSTAAPPVL